MDPCAPSCVHAPTAGADVCGGEDAFYGMAIVAIFVFTSVVIALITSTPNEEPVSPDVSMTTLQPVYSPYPFVPSMLPPRYTASTEPYFSMSTSPYPSPVFLSPSLAHSTASYRPVASTTMYSSRNGKSQYTYSLQDTTLPQSMSRDSYSTKPSQDATKPSSRTKTETEEKEPVEEGEPSTKSAEETPEKPPAPTPAPPPPAPPAKPPVATGAA